MRSTNTECLKTNTDLKRDWASIIGNSLFLVMDYVISFFVVSMTASAWCYDANLDFAYKDFSDLFLKILITYCLLGVLLGKYKNIKSINKTRIGFAAICIATYTCVNAFGRDEFVQGFVLILVGLIIWMSLHENIDEIWGRIVNIIVVIAIISLIFNLFGSYLRIIPEYNTAQRIWGDWSPEEIKNYFYLYYEAQQLTLGNGFVVWRNCGIFAESPMYNFVLCFALTVEIFLVNKTSKWKIAVLVITVFSAFSTTGFLFLVVLSVLYLLKNKRQIRIGKIIQPYLKYIICGAVVLCVLIVVFKGTTSSGQTSSSVRTDHLVACLKALGRWTIYGCGWSNRDFVLQFANYKQGLSVGLPYFMACGGLLLSSVLLIPVIHDGVFAFRNNEWNLFCFEMLFLILFFFTIVMNYPIFILGLGYILIHGHSARAS